MIKNALVFFSLLSAICAIGMAPMETNGAEISAGVVDKFRGQAWATLKNGQEVTVHEGFKLNQGDTLKVGALSFVGLVFPDRSRVNVGALSVLKIEAFSKNQEEPGVLNLMKGKIRAKVPKERFGRDGGKSKLFIKTESAVMGVRGTDFIFTSSPDNGGAAAILFEGSILFNRYSGEPNEELETIVNKGKRLWPGQFSIFNNSLLKPSIPANLNPAQYAALRANKTFKENVASAPAPTLNNSKGGKGFVLALEMKPADGSMVLLQSARVAPLSDAFKLRPSGEVVSLIGPSLADDAELVESEERPARAPAAQDGEKTGPRKN